MGGTFQRCLADEDDNYHHSHLHLVNDDLKGTSTCPRQAAASARQRKLVQTLYRDMPLPAHVRSRQWMQSSGIQQLFCPNYYESCLRQFEIMNSGLGGTGAGHGPDRVPHTTRSQLEQIQRDLHRIGCHFDQVDRTKLLKLCKAMCSHDRQTGYTQGMNILGAKLLVMLNGQEEEAFWGFVYLSTFGYTSSFNHVKHYARSALVQDAELIDRMLAKWPLATGGNLLELVHSLHLDSNLYATVPLVMLLVEEGCGFNIPREESEKVWDCMFMDGHHFVVLCAVVAIFVKFSGVLMTVFDATEATELLHSLPVCPESEPEPQGQGIQRAKSLRVQQYFPDAVRKTKESGSFESILLRVMRVMECDYEAHRQRHRKVLEVERSRIQYQFQEFQRGSRRG